MSGHSKWANIKHKKDAADRKKGKIFSRITKEIIAAAKQGGGDPDANPRLRNVLLSARSVNMPNANIDRAIKKATGELGSVVFEEICYEAYAPGGTAILVDCLTDNRNRTAGEIRMLLDRGGGKLAGTPGTVLRMFHRKSHFVVTGPDADENKLFELVVDAGAENIEVENGVAEIYGPPESFQPISDALHKAGIKTEEATIVKVPENYISISDPAVARQVINLVEKLEDQDDVQAVHSNFDVAPDILAQVQG